MEQTGPGAVARQPVWPKLSLEKSIQKLTVPVHVVRQMCSILSPVAPRREAARNAASDTPPRKPNKQRPCEGGAACHVRLCDPAGPSAQSVVARAGRDHPRPQRLHMPCPHTSGFGVDIDVLPGGSVIPHYAAAALAVVALWDGDGLGRLRGGGLVLWTGG
jgi:hypothetical protein